MSDEVDLTGLLQRGQAGDEDAVNQVFEHLYNELHRLARWQLHNGGNNAVLGTTELVHEAFLKFSRVGQIKAEDRRHFLHYASRVMRSVVVDTVRERQAQRRGGNVVHLTLNTAVAQEQAGEQEILYVHNALEALLVHDARMAAVVEMRYFAGLTEMEVAEALGVTERTVRRIWQRARLWLEESIRG